MFKIANRVKETTTTTGTGTYTLAGAVPSYLTFTSMLSNGDSTCYLIEDGTDWEIGIGTFTTSGTTLARTTVLYSSNANAAVSWAAGTRTISISDIANYTTPLAMVNASRSIQVADQTALSSTSGNLRGAGAVDLQISRSVANRVASGDGAVVIGGINNLASGQNSFATGDNNSAIIDNTFATGKDAIARFPCSRAISGGKLSTSADAQSCEHILRVQTTNSAPTLLECNSQQRIDLSNDSTFAFDILVVARRTDADNESAAYHIRGCIDRNTNAASTALVGSVNKDILAEDTSAWDVDVQVDTTNGGLQILVTGEASKTINWVAHVRTVEVVG